MSRNERGETRAPAFQFYPQDYLSSSRVAEMSLEEEGVYIRLLCYCWSTGSIPADPERCARLAGKGCSIETATNVQRAFSEHPTDSERLVHDRLEFEREKQAKRRDQASEAGRKSGESRAASRAGTNKNTGRKKSLNGRSTDVQRKPNTSSSSSSSSSSSENTINTISTDGQQTQVDQFAAFWQTYPRKISKPNAIKAWQKAIRITSPEVIIQGAARYAKVRAGADPEFTAHPATWLNGRRWEDDLTPPPKPNPLAWQKEMFRKFNSGEITEAEFNAAVKAKMESYN